MAAIQPVLIMEETPRLNKPTNQPVAAFLKAGGLAVRSKERFDVIRRYSVLTSKRDNTMALLIKNWHSNLHSTRLGELKGLGSQTFSSVIGYCLVYQGTTVDAFPSIKH
jgi:hypothetical protein